MLIYIIEGAGVHKQYDIDLGLDDANCILMHIIS